jgi:uncharacterized membrane protein YgcG
VPIAGTGPAEGAYAAPMLRGIGAAVVAAVAVLVFLGAPAGLRLFSGGGQADFPDPVTGRAVYDPAGALSAGIEEVLEAQIDEVESRSGAEVVVYARIDPSVTPDGNLADAQALIDQWGIGRAGFDDGFVILLSFDDDQFAHGELATYAGSGFRAVYLGEEAQVELREQVIGPAIRQLAPEGGLVEALIVVDAAVTPEATGRLETYRVVNAMVGIPGSILALFLTLGLVYSAWRRYGDDPDLVDSPSVLMAGPPAGMSPPLATVVRDGRASQHSINTTLVDLAGQGLIAFRNLDQVGKVKSDDDPNPLIDPAIEVRPMEQAGMRKLGRPQQEAYATIRSSASGGELTRDALWGLNGELEPLKGRLEGEAVRLGWLSRTPTPIITRWVVVGVAEILIGAGLAWLGYGLPMSGLTLLGAALAVGGIGTVALGNAMSQRTPKGAYVDAMLKAFRRTLQKTMERARNMGEVVAQPEVRVMADTPDKAVVWGIALGLQREVGAVLERGLEDARAGATADGAYYPVWLGSPSSSSSFAGASATGSGMAGLFSGGGTPDIGGMFSALGSVGSSPPSSSSGSGGGFGGGGSSGGGGGNSSF